MDSTIGELYTAVHTPLVLVLCTAGAVGHLLSSAILWKQLNPTNLLLISMSATQLVLCVNFLYSTSFKYGSEEVCIPRLWSFGWTATLLISVNLSVFVHMCGVFHVVALSIIRYLSLRQLAQVNSSLPWFTYQKCAKTLLLIYGSVIVICGPLYFHAEIREATPNERCTDRFPEVADETAYQLALSHIHALQQINFWLFGSICKLIPCTILSIMTVLILRCLKRIRDLSARFQNVERDRQYHRTTKIILVVMVVFVIVELPQGVLAVLQAIMDVGVDVRQSLGDLFEMLTLLTSCLIFALFCSMNSKIRNAFVEAFDHVYAYKPLRFLHGKDVSGGRHLLIGDGSDASENKKPKQVVQSMDVEDEEGHVYL
ncbi:Protein DMSR-3 [Aphelenchoides avenae]|nr:Protein DMSR-3 [Aphelenchus avenae]